MVSVIHLADSWSTSFALLYADPGSGMLIWQMVTAAFLGLLFQVKNIVRRIRSARRTSQANADEANSQDPAL